MKKQQHLFLAAFAIAAMAGICSCNNDDELAAGQSKSIHVFTATMEGNPATRATFNSENKCAYWQKTDKVSINGFVYIAQNEGAVTTFVAEDEEVENSPYRAYFGCEYDGTIATLPSAITETYAEGKFNMPMYATSTTNELPFKNLCGVLAVTVKSSAVASVKKVKISSSNYAISGIFTVQDNEKAVLNNAVDNTKTLTVTYTEAVETNAQGKVFYFAVPSEQYAYHNLKIEIDPDGKGFTKAMAIKSGGDVMIERNKIYPVTFVENVPPADPHLLPGLFSVSATKKVQFTRYNIYWDGSALKFENSPIGHPTTIDSSHMGFFAWVNWNEYNSGETGKSPYIIPFTHSGDSYPEHMENDVFWCGENHKLTVEGTEDLYVLTADEWDYMIRKRTNYNKLRQYNVTVEGLDGCQIFAPDDYDFTNDPYGITKSTAYSAATLTFDQLSEAGFLCLPPTGQVYNPDGDFDPSKYIINEDGLCFYCTASTNDMTQQRYVYNVSIKEILGVSDQLPRDWYLAIRLVK